MSFSYIFKRSLCQPLIALPRMRRSTPRLFSSFSVTYDTFGDPAKVLYGKKTEMSKLTKGQVLLKLLAAPVNPADINMIQGVYPVKPAAFPAIGGNESVCEVIEVSEGVKNLQVGDWVLPSASGSGTWQTFKAAQEDDLVKVQNDIPVVCAATLTVNPRTAYRMLKDFVDLKPGDIVIQNGANSGVGQAVIQIAAKMGCRTINIVRDRDDITQLVDVLKNLGATHVLTAQNLNTQETKDLMKSLPRAKLALNCVGGKASADLLKFIVKRGTMVTYGGMSKQPLMIPAGPLIFNDVRVRGFWVTQWTKENFESAENQKMNCDLTEMIKRGELKAPTHRLVQITNFESAITKAMESFISEKQILVQE